MSITKEQVLAALRNVDDPDLHKDLVSLNMIKDIVINGNEVKFSVILTTPACPMKDMIKKACENAILYYVDKNAIPMVSMGASVTAASQEGEEKLEGVKNIIAVASGKGGVGKSTVAANLAVGLAELGATVGLVDADIYGPSMPLMFNVVNEKPKMREVNGQSKMGPVESHGIKLLSIGFFADPAQAIPWRGPMASKALRQLFFDADWGELDYMIIDLPPGTGDIHLTLVSAVPISGAVIVTTPQAVALADAEKGVNMFQMPQINVPVLGIIENMSYFTPDEMPDKKYYIFGKDGGKQLAERIGVPLLGQVPIVQEIRESGDTGSPAVLDKDTPSGAAFRQIAQSVAQHLAIFNSKNTQTVKAQ